MTGLAAIAFAILVITASPVIAFDQGSCRDSYTLECGPDVCTCVNSKISKIDDFLAQGQEQRVRGDLPSLADLLDRTLAEEISYRLGAEVVATDGLVTGTRFNDRVIARDGVTGIGTGAGNDFVVYRPGTAATIPYGAFGPGADTVQYIDVTESAATVARFNYVVGSEEDIAGDRIIFPAGSSHVFISPTTLEVVEADGDVLLIDFVDFSGNPTTADLGGMIYTDLNLNGLIERHLVVAGPDGLMPRQGTQRSETLVYNDQTQLVSGGGGEDVIVSSSTDFAYDPTGRLDIFGGFGNDLIYAAPSADTNAHGGAGADRVFFQYDYFDNVPLQGIGAGVNVELDGDSGDDEILMEVHTSDDGSFAANGGSGRDRIEIVYRTDPGTSTVASENVHVDGGVDGNDFLIWKQDSANTGTPVVGNYRFNGGDGDDQFFIDLRGLGGGTFKFHDGEGSDTITLRYDMSTGDIEECLIFDIGSGGVQTRTTTEAVLLPDFNAATTEVSQSPDGQYVFIDLSTGLVQTIGFEYDNGQALTPEEVEFLVGDDFIFL